MGQIELFGISMGQIELFGISTVCKQMTYTKFELLYIELFVNKWSVFKWIELIELLVIQSNTLNHSTECKNMSSDSYKKVIKNVFTNHIFNN